MSTLLEYVHSYADVPFSEMPFCDGDNTLICKLSYMPFERVISDDITAEPIPYPEAAEKIFAYNDKKFIPLGLWIDETVSIYTMDLARTKRYGEIRMVGCACVDRPSPCVQFGAQTYLLPDGTIVIPFRGTNDSLYGWKEDLDILTREKIPSYQLALDYLEKAAAQFPDSKIILCGHSKGGHVALYAALNTKQEIRDRIAALYNNDGPGFADYRFFRTKAYRELQGRYHHYLPDSSLVGLMLAHDSDYKIVHSTQILGVKQHDVTTWQLEGTQLETLDTLTDMGKITDLVMKRVLLTVTDAQKAALDSVTEALILATGESMLADLAKNVVSSVQNVAKAWVAIDRRSRRDFIAAFAMMGKLAVDAVKTVKHPEAETRGRLSAISSRLRAIRG